MFYVRGYVTYKCINDFVNICPTIFRHNVNFFDDVDVKKKIFNHYIIVEQVAPDHLHERHTNLDEPDVAGYPRQTYFFYRGVAAPNTTTISTFLL